MNYTWIPDLAAQEIPSDGILSRTLYADDQIKVVLFAFSVGQELSEHTASTPAIIQVVKGEARLMLGSETVEGHTGTWVYMPAQLVHSVQARAPLVMLLILLKAPGGTK
jgi:quercetin dioxygenase-like cupin family protein